MRIGTKILLLMLLITTGSLTIVSWIVTLNLTRHETERANDQIASAIARYAYHLDSQHQQISHIVRALLEAPAQRSLLQAAGDTADTASREQLKQEVIGRDVQTELQSREQTPAFQLLINLAHEIVVVRAADPHLEQILACPQMNWPAEQVLTSKHRPVMRYTATPFGLFLAMGVPLHTQLDEAPDNAYFIGFRVNDEWVQQQLLAGRGSAQTTTAPLVAWFMVNDAIVARASTDTGGVSLNAFSTTTPLRHVALAPGTITGADTYQVQFEIAGEHFLGQSFNLNPDDPKAGRLILASSLDHALAPLHRLERQILWTAIAACLIAVIACRAIASMISRPIRELVAGTHRIALGQFDHPIQIQRQDELGTLADSFNEMALGLKERDSLREERVKTERDLALARKIQMDVLPKELPVCPGYDMAAFSLPAEQTGGDIYDLITVMLDPQNAGEPQSTVLLLADATGHGIGPALSVTQVRSMLRIGVRLRAGLKDLLSQINRQLCQDPGYDRFVTAFLGLLDPVAHRIDYHSAGQAPLLHFHAHSHRFEWLNASMIPLGIEEEAHGDGIQHMQLEPGDLIILLTDGFYEYHNAQGELLGEQRIAEIILRHHHLPARELLDEIISATRAFSGGAPQLDDMTGLIVRRLPVVE